MIGILFCSLFVYLVTLTKSSCPYANMMKSYNFSGNWVMTDEDGVAYVLHICHPKGNEMFFGLAKNNTPNVLLGFGGGNWSQWNMGIIGIRYLFHDNKVDESGFLIGMNTEGHQWWYKDNNKSLPINQTTQDWISVEQCMVPFGFELRREKYEKFKKMRAAYHKEKRERAKQAKKKKIEVDEEQELEYERQYNESIEVFEKSYENNLPTLINTTWANNYHNHKISFYNDAGCFSNASSTYSMNNFKVWYDDVLIMSEWSNNDIRGAQFNLLLAANQMVTVMVYSNNDQTNETLTFIETKHDVKLECPNIVNRCENSQKGNIHCEL